MDFNTAVAYLCGPLFISPSSLTRLHEDVLVALLPASRTTDGRLALGASPGAVEALARVLRDPCAFLEPAGVLSVRLLRNLCARSVPNQRRAAAVGAHALVLAAVRTRVGGGADGGRPAALRRIDDSYSEAGRLGLPFFGAGVEFLCNFSTCNAGNADLVWEDAFPDLFFEILESDCADVCAAGTALLHNCIATCPGRAKDVLRRWTEGARGGKESGDGGRAIAGSLITRLHMRLQGEDEDGVEVDEATFWWTCQVVRRLVGAGLLEGIFEIVGPPLDQIRAGASDNGAGTEFSPHQITLVVVLEAAISEAAESGGGGAADFCVPDSSLPFFGELLQVAWAKRNGSMFQLAASIAGSLFLVAASSDSIDDLKQPATAEAVSALVAIHLEAQRRDSGSERGGEQLANSNNVTGLRGAAVRLIALASHEDRKIQDLVRDMSGLIPVLSALSYEKDVAQNPFLREWAVIAVRNLCCGNEENGRAISRLELVGVQGDEAMLAKAGLEAVMGGDGKPVVRVKK